MSLPINEFLHIYYLPIMNKLCFHLPHFIMLSKHYCGRTRKEAIIGFIHDLFLRRDYADQLIGKFDMEVQSTHVGDSITLSMERCSVEFNTPEGVIKMNFHFHFADKSPQNAGSTNAHMESMFEKLLEQGSINKGNSTLWEVTDGCSKQCRCGKALLLLRHLATCYDIVFDICVDAPGHGKGIIDAIQGVEKEFLRRKFCMVNKDGFDSRDDRFEAAQMTKYGCKSFAMECIRLCSHESRKMGVYGDKKHALRESRKKLVERYYHYQQYDANQEICADIKFTGFDSGPHGGIR